MILYPSHILSSDIDGLGDLAGGSYSSLAYGISGDGLTVVGKSNSSNGTEAFQWTQSGGIIGLGDLVGGTFSSRAEAINNDGTVIVGTGNGVSGSEAFRWTQAGGMVGLGDLAGGTTTSYGYGVSDDGLTVVGMSNSVNGNEAFKWTQAGGMVGLGDLAGGLFYSRAFDVSSDGSIIVGEAHVAKGGFVDTSEAFRWTQAGGMVGLGDLAGGFYYSVASAISDDGNVIVGTSNSSNGYEAFKWTQAGGMVGLGDLAGGSFSSRANAVNTDGTVIVGAGTHTTQFEAFIWKESTGMLSLSEWLLGSGLSLTDWSFTEATGVSDDGKTVVGYGNTSSGKQAFVAKEKNGLIGLDDTYKSLVNISTAPSLGVLEAGTILNGMHGHPIVTRTLDHKRLIWVSGDYLSDDRYETDDKGFVSEIGMSFKYNENILYSASIGQLSTQSNVAYNGGIESKGYFFTLESDIRVKKDIPLYLTVTYLHGNNDLDITRGYLNAGSLDASMSTTKQSINAFKSRFQYNLTDFSPYIDYEYIHVNTDGFIESGGGFPASFEDIEDVAETLRIGFDKLIPLNKQFTLITSLESTYNLRNVQGRIKGKVIDTFSFDIARRETIEQEDQWFKGTIGLSYVQETYQTSITFNSTTAGEDSNMWIGFNLALAF